MESTLTGNTSLSFQLQSTDHVVREYPGADDRGGIADDFANFVSFLKNLRNALDNSGMPTRPGLSITLVSVAFHAITPLTVCLALFVLVSTTFRYYKHRPSSRLV
jgi:hypothetical protein